MPSAVSPTFPLRCHLPHSQKMSSKLFEPITIGDIKLQHRVVLAPLTRLRASPNNVHNISLAKEYYEQRASYPGTLLITEGTPIAGKAGGLPYEPGIWNDEQIAAWKEVYWLVGLLRCVANKLWICDRSQTLSMRAEAISTCRFSHSDELRTRPF